MTSRTPLDSLVIIEPGSRFDLDALKIHHYRAPNPGSRGVLPATFVHILRARLAPSAVAAHPALASIGTDRTIGVLAVSLPALNDPGAWRTSVWPDLFPPGLSPRQRALRINQHLRTISRVIVDPRLWGLGFASALTAGYLARPSTLCTEALAAMGHVSGIFISGGMSRAWPAPDTHLTLSSSAVAAHASSPAGASPCRADTRLLRALAAIPSPRDPSRGIQAWELVDPANLLSATSPLDRSRLIDALRTWARASRATRRAADTLTPPLLVAAAARRLASRPVVFAHRVAAPLTPAPIATKEIA